RFQGPVAKGSHGLDITDAEGYPMVRIRQVKKSNRRDSPGVVHVFRYPIFGNKMPRSIVRTVYNGRIIHAIPYSEGRVHKPVILIRRIDFQPATLPGIVYRPLRSIAPVWKWIQPLYRISVNVVIGCLGLDKRVDKRQTTHLLGLRISSP